MTENAPKAIVSDLDPFVITAPTIRSGTTLLQRLLCSSSKALIYGELCAQDLEFFLNFYTFKSQQYRFRHQEVSTSLSNVLARDVKQWIPTLMPEIPEYLSAIGRAAFAGITYCRDYAAGLGRPVWGFKYPGWNPATIRLMRAIMPRSRFIIIYRELKDCLKSAKAHAMNYGVDFSKPETEEFCRSWHDNRTYLLSLSDEATVLPLQFDELIRQPRATLARLADFTGLDDMNPEVLNYRINTWAELDSVAQSKDGYVAPVELDDSDWQIINAATPLAKEQPRAF
jgi:Sulfotransferase family